MKTGYPIEETRGWDWSLNNADLARQYNISRERVRQIRKILEIPYPKIRGAKERQIVNIVEKIKQENGDVTVDSLKSAILVVTGPYLRKILGKHKINYIHGNRKYPWEKVNWNLPNITISDIWGIPYSDVVEYRNSHNEGDALWERNSGHEKFIRAVEEERIKVANNNCHNSLDVAC